MDAMAKKDAYITLKDHKDNFSRSLPCRLINPSKSEIGIVSKSILDTALKQLRPQLQINAWRNTAAVIEWFSRIPEKENCIFVCFDIVDFYPSISEDLLQRSVEFARRYTDISQEEGDIIFHARRSLLFGLERHWVKRHNEHFDVTMGCYDGAEVCELVGAFALAMIADVFNGRDVGLYRDDGLAVFRNASGHEADRIRKEMTKIFQNLGLKITIQTNLKRVDFLDVTLDLTTGKYCPYRKPNDKPMYINCQSNHPPTIIQNLPASISRRLTDISNDEDVFIDATPIYSDALRKSGYRENVQYFDERKTDETKKKKKRNRPRNIIWFNPPFSKNVATNVGHRFLQLVAKHFPKGSSLNKIFNRNSVKVSYSCMQNMATIIKQHNNTILRPKKQANGGDNDTRTCNCRAKDSCPLDGACLTESIVYKARVTAGMEKKEYTGLTATTFKQRYYNHQSSFRHRQHEKDTRLSQYVWTKKDEGKACSIQWAVHRRAAAYSNKSKRCNLCLAEKLAIAQAPKHLSLNKRSELVSKCRHENRYYLRNFKPATAIT